MENALEAMLEPKDKLDAVPVSEADATGAGVVNGPEDETLDWSAVEWPVVEDRVRRLRQRIFTASKAGDLANVRNLQRTP